MAQKNIKVPFPIPVSEKGRIKANDAKKLLKHLAAEHLLKVGTDYFVTDSTGHEEMWTFSKSMDWEHDYEFSCEVVDDDKDYYNCLYFDKRGGKIDFKSCSWDAHLVECTTKSQKMRGLQEGRAPEIEEACKNLKNYLWSIEEEDPEYRAKEIIVKYQNEEIYIGYLSQEADNKELFDYLKYDENILDLQKFNRSIVLEVGNRCGDTNIRDYLFTGKSKNSVKATFARLLKDAGLDHSGAFAQEATPVSDRGFEFDSQNCELEVVYNPETTMWIVRAEDYDSPEFSSHKRGTGFNSLIKYLVEDLQWIGLMELNAEDYFLGEAKKMKESANDDEFVLEVLEEDLKALGFNLNRQGATIAYPEYFGEGRDGYMFAEEDSNPFLWAVVDVSRRPEFCVTIMETDEDLQQTEDIDTRCGLSYEEMLDYIKGWQDTKWENFDADTYEKYVRLCQHDEMDPYSEEDWRRITGIRESLEKDAYRASTEKELENILSLEGYWVENKKGNFWILTDDDWNEYEAEVNHYSDGGWELMKDNIHATGEKAEELVECNSKKLKECDCSDEEFAHLVSDYKFRVSTGWNYGDVYNDIVDFYDDEDLAERVVEALTQPEEEPDYDFGPSADEVEAADFEAEFNDDFYAPRKTDFTLDDEWLEEAPEVEIQPVEEDLTEMIQRHKKAAKDFKRNAQVNKELRESFKFTTPIADLKKLED